MQRDMAVTVEGVSKIFRLGVRTQVSDSLGGLLIDLIKSPIENYRKYRSLYTFDDVGSNGAARADVIWALRDVSFSVAPGEVLGIIGRNGAGKSTLLKILTRITPPTTGRAVIRGRVSSLLEVGTGFHRELTGRENIYLNGTILGMKKKEVDRKFDEIVDFSGVEKFLDTPVKRYSSGMAVRLAFAVAAHLEPEILIVDEVLAVGDADFQKKCINKMKDVHKQGHTVLFVSHNMPAVTMLCNRAILLRDGTVVADGSTHDVVASYLSAGEGSPAERVWPDPATAPGSSVARLVSVRAVSGAGRAISSVDVKQRIGIEMCFEVLESGHVLLPHFWFFNDEGTTLFGSLAQDNNRFQLPFATGRYTTTAWLPANFLSPGTIFVTASLITRGPDEVVFDEQQVIAFNVIDTMGPDTARGDWGGHMPGAIRPLLQWTTEHMPSEDLPRSRFADVSVSYRG